MLSFTSKVSSDYHFRWEIFLSTFSDELSQSNHALDVVRSLQAYIKASSLICLLDHFFIVPMGSRKGNKESARLISSWISLAYGALELPLPDGVKTHSTRGMAASWAVVRQISLMTICKVASWSSSHSFIAHYCIDPAAIMSISIDHKVLSMASRME